MPLPSLGASNHDCILLVPVYKLVFSTKRKKSKCGQLIVFHLFGPVWTAQMFNYLCDSVSSYISFCKDLNKVIVYPNNRPWITKELKMITVSTKRLQNQPLIKIDHLQRHK